jgi:sulfite exporter TauE/SafE
MWSQPAPDSSQMMDWILGGLAFGFFGSVHCVGMCGPLALSLPGARADRWRFVGERLVYNLGRAVTYTLLGGLVGALGMLMSLTGVQQWVSIGIGAVMILGATVPWVSRQVQALEQWPAQYLGRVMQPIQSLYKRGGAGAMFIVGLLNGLLPCGFVYAALATAVTAGNVTTSMTFMAAFGLGTLPAMFGVSVADRLVPVAWRQRLYRLVPVGLVVVGVLLILRGLALGSMLSPNLQAVAQRLLL